MAILADDLGGHDSDDSSDDKPLLIPISTRTAQDVLEARILSCHPPRPQAPTSEAPATVLERLERETPLVQPKHQQKAKAFSFKKAKLFESHYSASSIVAYNFSMSYA